MPVETFRGGAASACRVHRQAGYPQSRVREERPRSNFCAHCGEPWRFSKKHLAQATPTPHTLLICNKCREIGKKTIRNAPYCTWCGELTHQKRHICKRKGGTPKGMKLGPRKKAESTKKRKRSPSKKKRLQTAKLLEKALGPAAKLIKLREKGLKRKNHKRTP